MHLIDSIQNRHVPEHVYLTMLIPAGSKKDDILKILAMELESANRIQDKVKRDSTVLAFLTLIENLKDMEIPRNGVAFFVEAFQHTIVRNQHLWRFIPPKPIKKQLLWIADAKEGFATHEIDEYYDKNRRN